MFKNFSNQDVIIIGSGPAGCAAAILCAQRGLRTIIIDGEIFPRHRPGETLHPGIEPLLEKLGVMNQVRNAGFLRHEGNWVKWEGECNFVPFGSDKTGTWYGFQAWRANFDEILLRQARSLGVEVLQPCHALQPIMTNNRVSGVITSEGEISAPFVVDATGRKQWLARKLKLQTNKYSPRLIARFGYVEGECPIRDNAPAIVADEKGWIWTAKVRPNIYQWTRLSFGNEILEKNWLPEEFHGLKPISKMKGADMTWRSITEPGGPGYFLIGDAATILDPASSHGVIKAIMSGIMVGDSIARIIKEGHDEIYVIQEYCRWLHDWFLHDVQKLNNLYSLLSHSQRKANY